MGDAKEMLEVALKAEEETITRYDTAIGPLVGLGILAAYAAVALGVATTLLRRRDA